MEVTCDDCGNVFDIFTEGYSSQYVTACGDCWSAEIANRAKGGIVTRGVN